MSDAQQALTSFIAEWPETPEGNRKAFIELKEYLAAKPGVQLDFIPRPGVTYSLRATHPDLTGKPLFVMADVIEDDPRWLSVCFYGEMITDPEEKGDFVPEGLLGEDAACFDLETYDAADLQYVCARIDEAFQQAAGR